MTDNKKKVTKPKSKRTAKGQFIKGASGNPTGRPKMKIDRELQALKTINRQVIEKTLHKYCVMDLDQCMIILKHKLATPLELMVISVIIKGIRNGDHGRLAFLFDNMAGPLVQEFKFSGLSVADLAKQEYDKLKKGGKGVK